MKKKMNARTPGEVFRHHGKAGERRDLDAYVSDFSPRSVLVTPHQVYLGRRGVREWILWFWEQLQDGKFEVLTEIRKRDVIFVRYTCTAKEYNIPDGVATFIVKNGFFSVLTNNYTLTPRVTKNSQRRL
jgi:hypothetical protein